MLRFLQFIGLLLVLVLGWLIGWSNNTQVGFSLLNWSLSERPVFVFYFAFLVSGIILGLVIGRFASRS